MISETVVFAEDCVSPDQRWAQLSVQWDCAPIDSMVNHMVMGSLDRGLNTD